MSVIERILVPIDFSAPRWKALDEAVEFSRPYNAELILVRCGSADTTSRQYSSPTRDRFGTAGADIPVAGCSIASTTCGHSCLYNLSERGIVIKCEMHMPSWSLSGLTVYSLPLRATRHLPRHGDHGLSDKWWAHRGRAAHGRPRECENNRPL
jgi:Universal stress protein family